MTRPRPAATTGRASGNGWKLYAVGRSVTARTAVALLRLCSVQPRGVVNRRRRVAARRGGGIRRTATVRLERGRERRLVRRLKGAFVLVHVHVRPVVGL